MDTGQSRMIQDQRSVQLSSEGFLHHLRADPMIVVLSTNIKDSYVNQRQYLFQLDPCAAFEDAITTPTSEFEMVDFSNYPYPTYTPNRILAVIYASIVAASCLAWLIQSIQNHFQPRRLVILILVSHIAICGELIVRASSSLRHDNAKVIFIMMTIFYTIGQRTIIISNFTCLADYYEQRSRLSRCIFLSISISIIVADLLMTPAGLLSFESKQMHLSFIFRQMSTALVCVVSLLFYPIWFWTKTFRSIPYEIIMALIIASFNSMVIAFFLLVMSIPRYYIIINDDEEWFYIFQILPMILILITWAVLHPKRVLPTRRRLINEKESNGEKEKANVF